MTDPDLAERVRAAWLRAIERHDERPATKVVEEISQAEADRAWNAALGEAALAVSESENSRRPITNMRAAIRALQRPQQPDKPTDPMRGLPDQPMTATEAIMQRASPPLSDAEILERAAEIVERRNPDSNVPAHLRDMSAQAQPAPEVDVFEAFRCAWSWSDAETGVDDIAREWFGPAIKSLEDIARLRTIHSDHVEIAEKALTELRERARRVGQ